jgi:hypothetical protein
VKQHFPHQARQRRAGELARSEPETALRLGGSLRRSVGSDLGAVDIQLEMEMREGVLDESGQLAPIGLERRVVA